MDPWKGEHEAAIKAAEERGDNASQLSSLYYGYATALRADGDEKGFQENIAQAVALSDSFVEQQGGIEALTAQDLDVRATVLVAADQVDGAVLAINTALNKEISDSHTEALLRATKADILRTQGNHDAEKTEIAELERLTPTIQNENQRIRILRARIRHYVATGDQEQVQELAEQVRALAEKTGAVDQLKKLEYDLQVNA